MKFLGILALGGLQGAIGWYMVKSGLSDRIEVSQYRLALHLTTAFMILGLLVWLALEEWPSAPRITGEIATPLMKRVAAVIVAAVLLQVVLGAFVAGLRAGYIYNTWPSMDGQFVPSDYWIKPAYLSFFESHAAAQFNHRMMAYLVAALAFTQIWLAGARPSMIAFASPHIGSEPRSSFRSASASRRCSATCRSISDCCTRRAARLCSSPRSYICTRRGQPVSSRAISTLVEAEHQLDVLNGRTRRALAEIVESRHEHGLI